VNVVGSSFPPPRIPLKDPFWDDEEPSPAPGPEGESKTQIAARSVAKSVEKKLAKTKRKRSFSTGPTVRERVTAEMDAMAESGDWSDGNGAHLVALYCWCHRAVYGLEPEDLDSKGWARAAALAARMILTQFGGDCTAAALFVRWAWSREHEREEYRRKNGRSGSRLTWWFQFAGGALVTEYRLDIARKNGR
jgi:hypothetical protein